MEGHFLHHFSLRIKLYQQRYQFLSVKKAVRWQLQPQRLPKCSGALGSHTCPSSHHFSQEWWSFPQHWPKCKEKLVHCGLLLFMKGGNHLGNKDLDLPDHISNVGAGTFHRLWKILRPGFMSTITSVQLLTQQDTKLARVTGWYHSIQFNHKPIANLILKRLLSESLLATEKQYSSLKPTGRRKEQMFSSLQISKGFLSNRQESV